MTARERSELAQGSGAATIHGKRTADVPDTRGQRRPAITRSSSSCDSQATRSPAGSGRYAIRSPRGVSNTWSHAAVSRSLASVRGASRASVLPRPKATRRRPAGCSEPSRSCLPVSVPRTRRAEQQEEGCGNDGRWKTRKTKTRFPFVSHRPWKSLRDSHNPTTPTTILSLPKLKIKKPERSPSDSKSPNPRLQAHPSMRKCLGAEVLQQSFCKFVCFHEVL